jgi:hypothetical protein
MAFGAYVDKDEAPTKTHHASASYSLTDLAPCLEVSCQMAML